MEEVNLNLQKTNKSNVGSVNWSNLKTTKKPEEKSQSQSSRSSFFSRLGKIFFNNHNQYTKEEKKLEEEIKELIKKEISVREALHKVRGEKAEEAMKLIKEQEKMRQEKEAILRLSIAKRQAEEALKQNKEVEALVRIQLTKKEEIKQKNIITNTPKKVDSLGFLGELFSQKKVDKIETNLLKIKQNNKFNKQQNKEQLENVKEFNELIKLKEKENASLEREAKELLKPEDEDDEDWLAKWFKEFFSTKEKKLNLEKQPEKKIEKIEIPKIPAVSQAAKSQVSETTNVILEKTPEVIEHKVGVKNSWLKNILSSKPKLPETQINLLKIGQTDEINKQQNIKIPQAPVASPVINIQAPEIVKVVPEKEKIKKEEPLNFKVKASEISQRSVDVKYSWLKNIFGSKTELPENHINKKIVPEIKIVDGPKEEKAKGVFVAAKKWTNPNIVETSLIKDEIVSYFNWKKNISLIILFIILSCGTIGFIYWSFNQENASLKADIMALDQDLNTQNLGKQKVEELNTEANVFKNKLALINSLLKKHIYWTNIFQYLEEDTIPETYYKNFAGDITGIFKLEANTKDFSSVVATVLAFRQDDKKTKDASIIGNINNQDGETSFSFNLTLQPNLFYK